MTNPTPTPGVPADREALWARLSEYTMCDGMLAAKCKAEFDRILADAERAARTAALARVAEWLRREADRGDAEYPSGEKRTIAAIGSGVLREAAERLAAGLPGGPEGTT